MNFSRAIGDLRIGLTLAVFGGAVACGESSNDDLGCGPTPPPTVEESYVCFEPTAASASEMTGSGGDTGTDVDGGTSTGESGLCAAWAAGPSGDYDEWSGPVEDEGQCCFTVRRWEDHVVCGRPLHVDGRARVAPSAQRFDWCATLHPNLDGIDEATRRALALAWLDDAAAEHASVASFARFALQAMAVATPPDLLVDTQRAMTDEVEHARQCYALASAYAGRDLGPDRLCMDDVLDTTTDLATLAASVVHEGCRGETLAALQARIASTRATDPVVRTVLERIADDETRHAALAWRFVAWALRQGDHRVHEAVARAFATPPATSTASPQPTPDLSSHGRLHPTELAALHRQAHTDLVLPLAHELLRTTAPARSDHHLTT